MRPTAGRWVSGDDFFDRKPELRVLESHVRNRNHILLTGQRRMGKTSIARELGRRLQPWDRTTSIECFERLAAAEGLQAEEGVADAVYDAMGLGIPHHVQSFFAQIRDFATLRGTRAVTVEDVQHLYRTEGQ